MSNRFNKAALLATSIMAGMVATPTFAQEAPAEEAGDMIVVTGSRIKRSVNVETAAPIAVVGAEEFKLSGTVNVENVINTLPQVVPGTTSASNNPGNGTATLNLRGMGEARTLVLVNGRRWMSYDPAQIVDLNTIPSFLIENVDVVTGGASAVYGSDAMSGVVNFRLKQVEGVELGGQYSLTQKGDGERYEIYGAFGGEFAEGKGHATVFTEYYNRSSIFQDARAFSLYTVGNETDGDNLGQGGSSTLPAGVLRYNAGGASGLGPMYREDDKTKIQTDSGIGAFAKNDAVVFDVAGKFRPRAGDLYNYAPANYLQLPQERYLMGGYADYEFSDGHKFYTEATFVNNRVATELAPTPITGTFNINLKAVQPFLDAASFGNLQAIDAEETKRIAAFNKAAVDPDPKDPENEFKAKVDDPGVVSLYVQRRASETGSRNSLDERNAFRILGGVTGEITDKINYDAYYMFARTRNANIQKGNISKSAFKRGLDGTDDALNIFGPNTLTPAMVGQISIQAQNGESSTVKVAQASVNGEIGSLGLGGNEVGFALGAEYRGLEARFMPDTALSSGDVIGFNAGTPTDGKYSVKEVFGELIVPVLGPDAGIKRLELTGAGRYSDYSLEKVGGVFTYAGGIEFEPIDGVTYRGQYQRAVRAPNVGELYGGRSIDFPAATDPCATPAAKKSGKLRDLCIANGVPTSALGTAGLQLNKQIPIYTGGNPYLGEETSESLTFGAVLQPGFMPGATLTVDYFDIKVTDAIATIGLETSFDLCFLQVQDQNNSVCAPFFANGPVRTAGGNIVESTAPSLGKLNVASLGAKGIDVQFDYRTRVPFSLLTDTGEQKLDLSLMGTWTQSSFSYPTPKADIVECAGKFGAECGEPTPEYKLAARASLIDGPLTTSLSWTHLSSVKDDNDKLDYSKYNGVEKLKAYNLFDLAFSFRADERMTLNFGINNLFNKLPQTPTFDADGYVTSKNNGTLLGDNQEQANTYPSTYDTLGRDFYVSVGFKF